MFSAIEKAWGERMSGGLKEIEELNINEDCRTELKSEISDLRNNEVISDASKSQEIKEEMDEFEAQLCKLRIRSDMIRIKLQKSDAEEFILDVTQHPEEIGGKKTYCHYNIKTMEAQELRN